MGRQYGITHFLGCSRPFLSTNTVSRSLCPVTIFSLCKTFWIFTAKLNIILSPFYCLKPVVVGGSEWILVPAWTSCVVPDNARYGFIPISHFPKFSRWWQMEYWTGKQVPEKSRRLSWASVQYCLSVDYFGTWDHKAIAYWICQHILMLVFSLRDASALDRSD